MTDSTAAPHQVRIERTFNAPHALIWQMWTDPRHFERWYGPTGATVVVAKMDLVVGGARHISMATRPCGRVCSRGLASDEVG